MPSRRSHTNSHHGCLQCKSKRVKCDQAQPKCSRCDKKNSECTYRHIMTNYNPFQYQQAARAAAAAAAAAAEGAGGSGAGGASASQPALPTPAPTSAYTTTTLIQTTPPRTISGGPPSSTSSTASTVGKKRASATSRSSSAPATPGGVTATAPGPSGSQHGPHSSSYSGIRKTSFSYHPQRGRIPTTPAPNAERIMRAIPTQANITTTATTTPRRQLTPSAASSSTITPPHHHHPPAPHMPPHLSPAPPIPTTQSLTSSTIVNLTPSTLPPVVLPLSSYTPTETTVGYTPAAMTIVTDPFTLIPVTSAPTPTTLVTTPSPPLLHDDTLPPSHLAQHPRSHPHHTSTTTTTTTAIRDTLPPLQDEDQFYLDHYTTNLTGLGMSPILESEIFNAVNSAILRHLDTSAHVRHVIIAYSALHLASMASPVTTTTATATTTAHAHHLSTALHHKALALERFRPAIEAGITPDNSEGLLATAAVLVACGFALPAADPTCRTGYNHIDLLAENFRLVQGTSAILQQLAGHRCGPLGFRELRNSVNLPSPVGDAPWSESERSLQILQQAIEAIPQASEAERNRRTSLLHSLAMLRRCIEFVGSTHVPTPITCVWLGTVQKDFIGLFAQRDPLAMALVSHWAINHRGNSILTWWMSAWLNVFMTALQETLAPEYKHLMATLESEASSAGFAE